MYASWSDSLLLFNHLVSQCLCSRLAWFIVSLYQDRGVKTLKHLINRAIAKIQITQVRRQIICKRHFINSFNVSYSTFDSNYFWFLTVDGASNKLWSNLRLGNTLHSARILSSQELITRSNVCPFLCVGKFQGNGRHPVWWGHRQERWNHLKVWSP